MTIPAGATRALMVFGGLLPPGSEGAIGSLAVPFNSSAGLSGAGYLDGLTQAQLGEIVNWNTASLVTAVPAAGAASLAGLAGLLCLAALSRLMRAVRPA